MHPERMRVTILLVTDVYKRQVQGDEVAFRHQRLQGYVPVAQGVALRLGRSGGIEPVSYTHLDVYKRQRPA